MSRKYELSLNGPSKSQPKPKEAVKKSFLSNRKVFRVEYFESVILFLYTVQ